MKPSPNQECPCCSGRKFKKCCGPILRGATASTPEALMRSRYTGYATQALDHIVNTTHPESPHYEGDRGAWLQDLKDFCTATHFRALEIHSTRTEGKTGWVRFTAHLEQENRAIPMQEHSEFHCVDTRWLYLKGIAPSP